MDFPEREEGTLVPRRTGAWVCSPREPVCQRGVATQRKPIVGLLTVEATAMRVAFLSAASRAASQEPPRTLASEVHSATFPDRSAIFSGVAPARNMPGG